MSWNRHALLVQVWPAVQEQGWEDASRDAVLLIADDDVAPEISTTLQRESFDVYVSRRLASALLVLKEKEVGLLIIDSGMESFPLDLFLFARDRMAPDLIRKTIFLYGNEPNARADLLDAQPGWKIWRGAELSELVYCARHACATDADAER